MTNRDTSRARPTGAAATRVALNAVTAPLILAWALAAVVTSAAHAQGFAATVIVASFCLLGVGVAFQMLLAAPRRTADTLLVVLGVGLASATVVSQTLLVLGVYHPTSVVGLQGIAVGALLLVREAKR